MYCWEQYRELSQNPVIFRAKSQRTVGPVIEARPAVTSEKHVVFHGFGWDNVCPQGEGCGWLVVLEELYAYRHCSGGLEGRRFAEPPPGLRWGVTFANGRSSPCAVHAIQRVGVDESLTRARIGEGNTADWYGNGAAVYLGFGGEGRVFHHCYSSNKTRSLLGKQGGVLIGVGGGHHSKNVAAVVQLHAWCREGISRRRDGTRRVFWTQSLSGGSVHFEDAVSTGGQDALRRQSLVARRWQRAVAQEASHGWQSFIQLI